MITTHDKMKQMFEEYLAENERFATKGVKAAAGRARKALGELRKLAQERRKEIQAEKVAATAQ
jgi:hypothetical protein